LVIVQNKKKQFSKLSLSNTRNKTLAKIGLIRMKGQPADIAVNQIFICKKFGLLKHAVLNVLRCYFNTRTAHLLLFFTMTN